MTIDSPNPQVSPYDLSDDDGYMWLKGNLHSHTTNSDGKPSPQERLDGYVNHGYDFLCLSDHYKITRIDTVKAPDEFVLIQGAELHPSNPFGGTGHHFPNPARNPCSPSAGEPRAASIPVEPEVSTSRPNRYRLPRMAAYQSYPFCFTWRIYRSQCGWLRAQCKP